MDNDTAKTIFIKKPFRRGEQKEDYQHNVKTKRKEGQTSKIVKFGSFETTGDEGNYALGTPASGLSLNGQHIKKRFKRPYKDKKEVLNRILTYLAENILSALVESDEEAQQTNKKIKKLENDINKGVKDETFIRKTQETIKELRTLYKEKLYNGLAEVQVGWVSSLNIMLITENSVERFNEITNGMNRADLLKMMTSKGKHKLKTQGLQTYYDKRMERHSKKLVEVMDANSERYKKLTDIDANVKDLIKFMNNTLENEIIRITPNNEVRREDLAGKIVLYDKGFGFGNKTRKHAELYHLEIFEAILGSFKEEEEKPTFYVAGTKRPCSTCAGELKVQSTQGLLKSKLIASYDHPGNLWVQQYKNLSDDALKEVQTNVENEQIYVTAYRTENKETKCCTGFNTDSDSGHDTDDETNPGDVVKKKIKLEDTTKK
ncbi:hypothetical protein TUMSATVNIG1_03890 [Vibrio nigripulchritudo]|uniref:hypothetical protein n=1 Tax=Vibrio nigripulchritudo TaxID=28173 RepID=UPI00190C03E2|nr:hypothetical protein [Vibrio nigripulchritudo]BCL68452.1 hypothetical protein VNTUMSATTG_03890 [Vibrio nigripulchritudo]BDU29780.1 hypothetical protein TUMSATVNIG1_03890 [Vibrio nigripulchritudo]